MDYSPPGSSRSMGFPSQEYWSVLPFPSPGHHLTQGSDPGIKPTSPVLAGGFFTTEPPGKRKAPYTQLQKYHLMANPTLFIFTTFVT